MFFLPLVSWVLTWLLSLLAARDIKVRHIQRMQSRSSFSNNPPPKKNKVALMLHRPSLLSIHFYFLLLFYFSRQSLSSPCQLRLQLTSPRVSTSCRLCQVGPTVAHPVETHRGAGGRPGTGCTHALTLTLRYAHTTSLCRIS